MSNYSTWKTKSFSQCVEKIIDHRGKTPKKLGLEWGNGNILALSANNVKKGKIDTSIEAYYGSEELYERWMTKGKVNKGDVIMTMEAPLGNVTQIPDNKKYILSQRVAAFKTIEDIDNDYFKYYLTSNKFQNLLYRFSTGTTAKGISQKNLRPLPVSYPSIKEQQKIASILSSVDEAIEKTKSIIEQAQVVKKGLMKELLTKGIRHVEFINSPIGKIPRKWKLKEFKEVMVLQRGYDLPTKDRNQGSYPLLSANGVTDYIDQYKVKGPGVVTGRSGTIGKVHFIENSYWPLNTSLYVKEMYDNNPKFLYYLLLSLKLERFSTGTGVPTLNRNIVHKEKVQVPPLSEQNQIAKILDSIGNKVEKETQKLSDLFVLKHGLMQQLLTGKIRVPLNENEEVPQ